MKFRPQIQLRFRHEAQYVLVKDAAMAQALSVNEWILRRVENGVMQTAGNGVQAAPVQERAVSKVRSRSKGNGASSRQPEEQAAGTEEVPAAKGGKKLTPAQFLELSNSEQMRAKREGKF